VLDVVQRLPVVARPDVGLVVLAPRYAGSPERQREAADAALAGWSRDPLPTGLVSLSVFTSLDGEALLREWGLAEAVRYRLFRSMTDQGGTGVPGCVITGTFDVDGPERQRHIVDALVDVASRTEPFPGALTAHFHLGADGTRVLNYAEWTSLEDHDRAMDNAELDEIYRVSLETPGVRATRGRACRLHGALHGALHAD
jgi:hypothetical protein